jgi:hypothetical protein
MGIHKVGEGVDENDTNTPGDVYGLEFLALAAARHILRVLTRIFYQKSPPT